MDIGLSETIIGVCILLIIISGIALFFLLRMTRQRNDIQGVSAGTTKSSRPEKTSTRDSNLIPLKREKDTAGSTMPQMNPFWDLDLPEQEDHRAAFMEERTMYQQATDMIRKSHRLFQLHRMFTSPVSLSKIEPKKRNKLLVSTIDPEDLKEKLHRMMEMERVYLNEELTISSLAHGLCIEPHQLSRFLNIHLRTTFTDLVNSYRVREAKTMLKDDPDGSILDIAFNAGFNSKASFNRIFKRVTGVTPSEFRMKIKSGDEREINSSTISL